MHLNITISWNNPGGKDEKYNLYRFYLHHLRRPPPYHTNLERSSIEHSIVFVYIITTIHKLREGFFVQASSSSAILFCARYAAVVVVFKCLVKIFRLSKKNEVDPEKKARVLKNAKSGKWPCLISSLTALHGDLGCHRNSRNLTLPVLSQESNCHKFCKCPFSRKALR